MFNTVEEIAEDIIKNNNLVQLKELFDPGEDFYAIRELTIEFPRWIRNTYKLWDIANPLTKSWHQGCRYMLNNVDVSGTHPDAVSKAIVQRVQELL